MRDHWYQFAIMQAGVWSLTRHYGTSAKDALARNQTSCIAVALSSERGDVKLGTTFSVETTQVATVKEVN